MARLSDAKHIVARLWLATWVTRRERSVCCRPRSVSATGALAVVDRLRISIVVVLTCCPMLLWAASTPASAHLHGILKIPAVAVSNAPGGPAAPQLAWITSKAGATKLLLATLSGKDAHAVAIPGNCAATGLRWANGGYPLPRSDAWHELAIITRCNSGGARMHSVIWLLDAHRIEQPPRKIADLPGYAHCMQWTAQNKGIAFLYVPGAVHPPDAATEGNCQSQGINDAPDSATDVQRVGMVSLADGKVKDVTPIGMNVYEFAWTTFGKQALLYVATQPGETRWNAKLYRKWGDASPAQWVVIDPMTSRQLRGRHVSMPSWGLYQPMVYFLAVKNAKNVAGGDWYRASAKGDAVVNLTEHTNLKPSWVDSFGTGARSVGGEVEILSMARRASAPGNTTRVLFSVPGAVSDGRYPLALSVTQEGVAYVEELRGSAPTVHAARDHGRAAPVLVAPMANSQERSSSVKDTSQNGS